MEKSVREKKREMEGKGWLVRQEERKNFSMMKQSLLLSDWTRTPPMGGPAPWQQALSPREKQPYPSTPPYFSFPLLSHDPLLPPLQGLVYFSLDFHIHKKKNTTRLKPQQHSSITQTTQIFTCDHTRHSVIHTGTHTHTLNGAYKLIRTSHSHSYLNVQIDDDSLHTLTVDSSVPLYHDESRLVLVELNLDLNRLSSKSYRIRK